MSEQSLKDKTAKGLFWGGLSNGFQQLLSLIFGIVLARILNASDYGMVGMLAIFSAITSALQESGLISALINRKEIKAEDYNAVFWFSTFLGVFFYVILFFLAPTIALFYEKPQLISLSRIVFLGFLFGGIGIASSGYMFKTLMVKERAKVDIFSLLISGIIGLVLAIKGFAYLALAIQSVLYAGIGSLLRLYYSPWKPSLRVNLHPLKEMFSFSYKLLLTTIFTQLNNNLLSVFMGKFYNETVLGFYSQGNKWMNMGNQLMTGMINGVVHPVFVNVLHDPDRQKKVFRKMMRFGAFVTFPVMLGLAFVSKEFIYICLGDKWLPSVIFLQLFCLWGAVGFMWNVYSYLLLSHMKSDLYMYGVISLGLLQLLVVFITYRYGILQMVIPYILCYYLGLAYWHYCVSRLITISIKEVLQDILPYLFATLFSFMIAYLVSRLFSIENYYILIAEKIVISACVYIILMKVSGSVIFKETCHFFLDRIKNK